MTRGAVLGRALALCPSCGGRSRLPWHSHQPGPGLQSAVPSPSPAPSVPSPSRAGRHLGPHAQALLLHGKGRVGVHLLHEHLHCACHRGSQGSCFLLTERLCVSEIPLGSPSGTPLAGQGSATSQRALGTIMSCITTGPGTTGLCHKGPQPTSLQQPTPLELAQLWHWHCSSPRPGHLWPLLCPGPCEALATLPHDSPSRTPQSPGCGGWAMGGTSHWPDGHSQGVVGTAPCPAAGQG